MYVDNSIDWILCTSNKTFCVLYYISDNPGKLSIIHKSINYDEMKEDVLKLGNNAS